jgi:parvulin-like peptidyl-prolyl isomerase
MSDDNNCSWCNDSLDRLLRSNISLHINKTITPVLLDELVEQIIDSIEYLLNEQEVK